MLGIGATLGLDTFCILILKEVIFVDLIRWEPFSSFRPWRPRRFFDEMMPLEFDLDRGGLNVYETKDDVVVEAAMPGIKEEDINVTVEGDLITVSGEARVDEKEEKDKKYYRKMEQRSFCYTTTSPRPVKGEGAEAVVEDGMVRVKIPKAEGAKPKVVKVKKVEKK